MLITELEKYTGDSAIADMYNDLSPEALLLLIEYTSEERIRDFIARIAEENRKIKFSLEFKNLISGIFPGDNPFVECPSIVE